MTARQQKLSFEELESPAFDYATHVTEPRITPGDKKRLKQKWLKTLKEAGWNEKEFNKEFLKHYPNDIPRLAKGVTMKKSTAYKIIGALYIHGNEKIASELSEETKKKLSPVMEEQPVQRFIDGARKRFENGFLKNNFSTSRDLRPLDLNADAAQQLWKKYIEAIKKKRKLSKKEEMTIYKDFKRVPLPIIYEKIEGASKTNSSIQNFIDLLSKAKGIKTSEDFKKWLSSCVHNPKWNTLSDKKKKDLIYNITERYQKK